MIFFNIVIGKGGGMGILGEVRLKFRFSFVFVLIDG